MPSPHEISTLVKHTAQARPLKRPNRPALTEYRIGPSPTVGLSPRRVMKHGPVPEAGPGTTRPGLFCRNRASIPMICGKILGLQGHGLSALLVSSVAAISADHEARPWTACRQSHMATEHVGDSAGWTTDRPSVRLPTMTRCFLIFIIHKLAAPGGMACTMSGWKR